jgi:hypothetical protein
MQCGARSGYRLGVSLTLALCVDVFLLAGNHLYNNMLICS